MHLAKYLLKKTGWYLLAFAVALVLNFVLPRLIPGNPVDSIVGAAGGGGGATSEQMERAHAYYIEAFGLDKSMLEQFWVYLANMVQGDFGVSFVQYPGTVAELVGPALPWTLALQLPAILIGWIIGNLLGAIAAYKGGMFDRGAFISSLFLSAMPYYCLAILLLYGLAVAVEWFPSQGGYSVAYWAEPELSVGFVIDALRHYWLPFFSLVIVFVGGQAIGMRSMAVYELGSDYVNYGRGLGLGDGRIVRYIFRNAMLPQVTGLALAIGALVSGALVTELVFNYPGVGTVLFDAISNNDYPVIQATVLLITIGVLVANYLVEVAYGFIDPRIRASETGER